MVPSCHLLLGIPLQILSVSVLVFAQQRKPHIFVVLVDDWGWANVGYHRDSPTKEVVTPNFDHLCTKEGVELDQHYVHRVCSPTRSSFLSGRLPIHVNLNGRHKPMHNYSDPKATKEFRLT
eukprot:m.161614 g.161614  ORF g.161614 m.161614 type:complete len:121 (+) comp38819_c2_seq4:530-892(+)